MQRLCERPGCSEVASVAYGMRAEDLVFWLDILRDGDREEGRGVLCRRHADSMVVPRNWTLDDLRDPDLHLFRPPPSIGSPSRRSGRRTGRELPAEQLELAVGDGQQPVAVPAPNGHRRQIDGQAGHGDGHGEPWSPTFDVTDDLGGLLAASSPLLARAFRGTDRSRGH
jgi:hypothetical protein